MLHSHLLLTPLLVASSMQPAASLVCDASAGHHGTGLRARGHKQAAAGAGSPVPTPGPGQLDGWTPAQHTPSKADLAVSMGASEEYRAWLLGVSEAALEQPWLTEYQGTVMQAKRLTSHPSPGEEG